ncbi:hypothetical protein D3C80_1047860 [compost metagenome]
MDQRFQGNAFTLGMLPPRFDRKHLRRAATGLYHRLLQLVFFPCQHLLRQPIFILMRTEHLLYGFTVMRCIGMQADPTVAGGIIARQRVPGRRQ